MTTYVTMRIYEAVGPDDGFRVLVDRLWPRGVSKERAALDLWAKDIAPSTELRKWFGHEDDKFPDFSRRYIAELNANPATPGFVSKLREHTKVTLLYGAKNTLHNEAVVLQSYLEKGGAE